MQVWSFCLNISGHAHKFSYPDLLRLRCDDLGGMRIFLTADQCVLLIRSLFLYSSLYHPAVLSQAQKTCARPCFRSVRPQVWTPVRRCYLSHIRPYIETASPVFVPVPARPAYQRFGARSVSQWFDVARLRRSMAIVWRDQPRASSPGHGGYGNIIQ